LAIGAQRSRGGLGGNFLTFIDPGFILIVATAAGLIILSRIHVTRRFRFGALPALAVNFGVSLALGVGEQVVCLALLAALAMYYGRRLRPARVAQAA
jgi:hypothetical protein